MKTTIDIPDELYRRVKARSALEGRPVRAIAVELFERWVESQPNPPPVPSPSSVSSERKLTRFDHAPWLETTQRYIKPCVSHDMEAIRSAIKLGWATEAAAKLSLSEEDG